MFLHVVIELRSRKSLDRYFNYSVSEATSLKRDHNVDALQAHEAVRRIQCLDSTKSVVWQYTKFYLFLDFDPAHQSSPMYVYVLVSKQVAITQSQ
jgi:hypothetical protein